MESLNGKRVLIALHRYSIGGAETQALYLAKGLKKRGAYVIVIAFSPGSKEGKDRFLNENLFCLDFGFSEKIILDSKMSFLSSLRKYRYLIKAILKIKKLDADAVVPFTYLPNVFFGLYSKLMGVHKCFWNQRDEGRLFLGSKKEIKALNNCQAIISNSIEGKQFLESFTSTPIVHISNGLDLRKWRKVNLNSLSDNVIMIGNIHGYKDHKTLIEAWALVSKRFPNKKLLLAGKKGNKYQEVKELIDKLELEDNIKILGVVDDVEALLSDCCLAVFSSENEGVPNGVLEPMACALPVVSTDIKGSREALGSEYPYLVKAGDAIALSSDIISLLSNPNVSKRIGQLNRSRVGKFYSMDKMIDQFESQIKW
mgnify:CR=1 FL=1